MSTKLTIYNVRVNLENTSEEFPLELADDERAHLLVKLQGILRKWPKLARFESVQVFKKGEPEVVYQLPNQFLSAPMSISIIGTGYVGLVTGVGTCHIGRQVVCVDTDAGKVRKINARIPPIYEKGLKDMLQRLPAKYFSCTTDLKKAVMDTDCTFIAVGTPPKSDGSQDLSYIKTACEQLGKVLKDKPGHLVVVKSTVAPGTTETIIKKLIAKNAGHTNFRIAMVPEFLREGLALDDFLNPFRIVIGVEDDESFEAIKFIYEDFNTTFFRTSLTGAEMIKYASNSLLATKISFANEIGNLCKKLKVDTYEVMDGVGLDKRFNRKFLNAGRGFGGSCLPKDVKALVALGKSLNEPTTLLNGVWAVNEAQPLKMVELAEKRIGPLKGKRVAVMGLAFKPGTDDVRESPAIIIIKALLERGANVVGYDSFAAGNMKKLFPNIEYAHTPFDAVKGSDVVLGVTEWPELRDDKLYRHTLFIDGMKFLNKKTSGNYEGICW